MFGTFLWHDTNSLHEVTEALWAWHLYVRIWFHWLFWHCCKNYRISVDGRRSSNWKMRCSALNINHLPFLHLVGPVLLLLRQLVCMTNKSLSTNLKVSDLIAHVIHWMTSLICFDSKDFSFNTTAKSGEYIKDCQPGQILHGFPEGNTNWKNLI